MIWCGVFGGQSESESDDNNPSDDNNKNKLTIFFFLRICFHIPLNHIFPALPFFTNRPKPFWTFHKLQISSKTIKLLDLSALVCLVYNYLRDGYYILWNINHDTYFSLINFIFNSNPAPPPLLFKYSADETKSHLTAVTRFVSVSFTNRRGGIYSSSNSILKISKHVLYQEKFTRCECSPTARFREVEFSGMDFGDLRNKIGVWQ